MKRKLLKTFITSILLFNSIYLYSSEKGIQIKGTKIYSQKYLIKKLKLNKFNITKKKSGRIILRKLYRFYREKGYSIVKIYKIDQKKDCLCLYIDEGMIGKTIFLNLGTLKTLTFKYKFKLPENIYNNRIIRRELRKLKKKHNLKRISHKLKKIKSYDSSVFQLDRTFDIPIIGEKQLLTFEKYSHRYDLLIKVKQQKAKKIKKKSYIGFKLKTTYSKGFIPKIKYYTKNVCKKGDKTEIGASVGILYGIDGNFSSPPTATFYQLDGKYHLPKFKRFNFIPFIDGLIYKSNASRKDLGLLKYSYLLLRTTITPTFEIQKFLKIHIGLGSETLNPYKSEIDPESSFIIKKSETLDTYYFLTTGLSFELIPIRVGSVIKKNSKITYRKFSRDNSFSSFEFINLYDFELKNKDIYSLAFKTNFYWGTVPYHHEIPVSNGTFKGFYGLSFHTRGQFSFSNEYRISIYKDFIYTGLFTDMVIFKGSGYDLTGAQCGVVTGPTLRFLILDQFEASIYYGQDFLFSQKSTHGNILFNISKKW